MGHLSIHLDNQIDYTAVSNIFIDHFMAQANGEYVKVYLYLLRCTHSLQDFSISQIADLFEHTEKDVCRALKYWEKQKLLQLEFDDSKSLTGICLLPPASKASAPVLSNADNLPAVPKPETDRTPEPAEELLKKPVYTADKLKEFRSREEIVQLLFIAEQYLEKTLSPTEISTILYFQDTLGFSPELIEYLIEYCVSKDHKSIRYIEKVALAWHSDGIHTIEDAKSATDLYKKLYFAVLKAFGIKGRNPGQIEVDYINRWSGEYGFTTDIILEACNRTIQAIHQPSFDYADSILKNWRRQNVQTAKDISGVDIAHKTKETNSKKEPAASTKFNNFQQRSYDFAQLEKELLGR